MYYADWIRVIAVNSVIFVHCLLNAADTVDLKDRDAMEKKEGICKVMAQLGMPLFFYISGMGLTFLDPEKTAYLSFVKSKARRLLVPLFLACVTLLVPRLYLSQEYEAWTRIDGIVESNFFIYFWKVIPTLHAKLSWLWFLGVLFIIMVLNYPFIVFSHRRASRKPFEVQTDGKLILGQILTLFAWSIPCATLVSESDAYTYLLPSVFVLGLFYSMMFII